MAAIGVGLVGLGFGQAVAFPALRATPGIEVTTVCDVQVDQAKAFAAANDIPHTVGDTSELVERDDVDLVVFCVPPMLHEDLNRAALLAGRHVFSTKPLAATAAGARQLRDLARDRGVVTAMDLDNRYLPVRRHLRNLVRDGYLGELRCVLATLFTGHALDPSGRLHYWGWTSLRDQSGGMLGASLLLHHVDLLRYTFGEVYDIGGLATTLITEKPVLAPGQSEWGGLGPDSPTIGTRPVDAEDMVVLHGRLEAGGVFSVTGTWSVSHGSGVRVEAYGTDGSLILEPSGRILGGRAGDVGLADIPVPTRLGGERVANASIARFELLFADVAASIRGEASDPLFATFDDGCRVREIASTLLEPAGSDG